MQQDLRNWDSRKLTFLRLSKLSCPRVSSVAKGGGRDIRTGVAEPSHTSLQGVLVALCAVSVPALIMSQRRKWRLREERWPGQGPPGLSPDLVPLVVTPMLSTAGLVYSEAHSRTLRKKWKTLPTWADGPDLGRPQAGSSGQAGIGEVLGRWPGRPEAPGWRAPLVKVACKVT